MTTPAAPPTPPLPKVNIPRGALVVYRGTMQGQRIVMTHGLLYRAGSADAAACLSSANALGVAWAGATSPRGFLSQHYVLDDISVLSLDSNASAVIVPSGARGGGLTGAAAVMSAAAVVSLKTGARGRYGQGRIFHGPLSAGAINDGGINITAPNTTGILNAWGVIHSAVQGANVPADMAVISRKYQLANIVTGFTVRPTIGTQRGRLR